eukprot:g39368.t1
MIIVPAFVATFHNQCVLTYEIQVRFPLFNFPSNDMNIMNIFHDHLITNLSAFIELFFWACSLMTGA